MKSPPCSSSAWPAVCVITSILCLVQWQDERTCRQELEVALSASTARLKSIQAEKAGLLAQLEQERHAAQVAVDQLTADHAAAIDALSQQLANSEGSTQRFLNCFQCSFLDMGTAYSARCARSSLKSWHATRIKYCCSEN